MGGPKHKWTAEEVAALKAGVSKYGVGKWRDILFDREFRHALLSRSNVDLKDKWRNISRKASDLESEDRASPQSMPKIKNISMPLSIVPQDDENMMPLATSDGSLQIVGPNEKTARTISPPLFLPEKESVFIKSNVEMTDITDMSIQEAVEAAARAVAEADTAVANAQEAVMETEAVEAEAEASKLFAQAAIMALNSMSRPI